MLIIKTESYMFNQLAYPDVHERRTLQPLIDDCLKTIFNFYTIIKQAQMHQFPTLALSDIAKSTYSSTTIIMNTHGFK